MRASKDFTKSTFRFNYWIITAIWLLSIGYIILMFLKYNEVNPFYEGFTGLDENTFNELKLKLIDIYIPYICFLITGSIVLQKRIFSKESIKIEGLFPVIVFILSMFFNLWVILALRHFLLSSSQEYSSFAKDLQLFARVSTLVFVPMISIFFTKKWN